MCKHHFPPPDQAEKSHFWMCRVQQQLTGAAAVLFTTPPQLGAHRIFPPPPSKAEGREHSDEPGDYKNVLFHVPLIGSSVSPPAAPLVCVGLHICK